MKQIEKSYGLLVDEILNIVRTDDNVAYVTAMPNTNEDYKTLGSRITRHATPKEFCGFQRRLIEKKAEALSEAFAEAAQAYGLGESDEKPEAHQVKLAELTSARQKMRCAEALIEALRNGCVTLSAHGMEGKQLYTVEVYARSGNVFAFASDDQHQPNDQHQPDNAGNDQHQPDNAGNDQHQPCNAGIDEHPYW